MRQVTDLTQSKRPQDIPDESDLKQIHLDVDVLSHRITEMEHLADSLRVDPEYKHMVRMAIARAHQISRSMCQVPVNEKNLMWHATAQGRLAEAWETIEKELGVRHVIEELERKKSLAQALIEPITSRIKEFEKRQK